MADRLRGAEGVAILNDVVLNQVLVRFAPPDRPDGLTTPNAEVDAFTTPNAEADAFTRAVIAEVQADGTCWLGGTTWHGMAAMRISVSNWITTASDIDVSADAILRCAAMVARAAAKAGSPGARTDALGRLAAGATAITNRPRAPGVPQDA